MNRYLVFAWGVIMLLPLLPVIALYALFDSQNYFKLEDTAKGILATGPIAAYFALVCLGWYVYRRFVLVTVVTSPALKDVMGEWDFAAESHHGTARTGHFTVENERGVLTVVGSFVDQNGKDVGNWKSNAALLAGKALTFVYDLKELRDRPMQFEGVTHVLLDDNNEMAGTWVVVGMADAYGSITCTKARAKV